MTDFEQILEQCEKKKADDEEIAYAFDIGRVIHGLFNKRYYREKVDFIKKTKGFIGTYPIDFHHTLVVYTELNYAKAARNVFREKWVAGKIMPVLAKKEAYER